MLNPWICVSYLYLFVQNVLVVALDVIYKYRSCMYFLLVKLEKSIEFCQHYTMCRYTTFLLISWSKEKKSTTILIDPWLINQVHWIFWVLPDKTRHVKTLSSELCKKWSALSIIKKVAALDVCKIMQGSGSESISSASHYKYKVMYVNININISLHEEVDHMEYYVLKHCKYPW